VKPADKNFTALRRLAPRREEIDSSEEFQKLLKIHLNIELSLKSQQKLDFYLNGIRFWNKRINLISRKKDKPEDIYRHFLDSLLLFKAIDIPAGSKILDLGSGAGFPAIPLKIIREDLNIVMVESIRKKVLFLKKMIELLELKNTEVLQERIENLQNSTNLTNSFDFITAKAFGKLKETITICYPFLRANGLLVAYKGSSYKSEIIEFLQRDKNPKLQVEDIKYFELPEKGLKRFFVLIQKTS
jgi:16S rRNA (guanine527-N7)-methyltransferase